MCKNYREDVMDVLTQGRDILGVGVGVGWGGGGWGVGGGGGGVNAPEVVMTLDGCTFEIYE